MYNVQVYSASQGLFKSRDPFRNYELFTLKENSKRIIETKVGKKNSTRETENLYSFIKIKVNLPFLCSRSFKAYSLENCHLSIHTQ